MKYNKTALPELLSVKSIISIFRRAVDWRFPPEKHDFYEISYVESGEANTLIDGVENVINEGQLVIFAPSVLVGLCKLLGPHRYLNNLAVLARVYNLFYLSYGRIVRHGISTHKHHPFFLTNGN